MSRWLDDTSESPFRLDRTISSETPDEDLPYYRAATADYTGYYQEAGRSLSVSRHELYGGQHGHGGAGSGLSLSWEGKARSKVERRAIRLMRSGHPHGLMAHCFSNKTVINVRKQLEARALYCELTRLLQGRSINGTERNAFHRIRDSLVEWVEEQVEKSEHCYPAPNGTEWSVERLKQPIDVNDPTLQRARERTRRDTIELYGDHPFDDPAAESESDDGQTVMTDGGVCRETVASDEVVEKSLDQVGVSRHYSVEQAQAALWGMNDDMVDNWGRMRVPLVEGEQTLLYADEEYLVVQDDPGHHWAEQGRRVDIPDLLAEVVTNIHYRLAEELSGEDLRNRPRPFVVKKTPGWTAEWGMA